MTSNTVAKVAQSFEIYKCFSSLPHNRIGDKHESSGVAFLFWWADKRDLPSLRHTSCWANKEVASHVLGGHFFVCGFSLSTQHLV